MNEGQAKTLESLRSLIERLSSPAFTLGEAKLLRLQLVQAMEEARRPGNESKVPGVTREPSTCPPSHVKTELTASAPWCC